MNSVHDLTLTIGDERLIFHAQTLSSTKRTGKIIFGGLFFRPLVEVFHRPTVTCGHRAVYNHRLSALRIGVDLHDENSFEDLANSRAIGFNKDLNYQSSIGRWNVVYDAYLKNTWSQALFELGRNTAPLSVQPWRVFRKLVAEFASVRGQFDPAKDGHVVIFLDLMAAIFILWSSIGRDVRRFYEPKMSKDEFEKVLLYYIWGGKESYQIRQELRQQIHQEIPRVFLPGKGLSHLRA